MTPELMAELIEACKPIAEKMRAAGAKNATKAHEQLSSAFIAAWFATIPKEPEAVTA